MRSLHLDENVREGDEGARSHLIHGLGKVRRVARQMQRLPPQRVQGWTEHASVFER